MTSRSPGTLWTSNIFTIWTPSEEKIARSSIFIQWETYQLELFTFVPISGCSEYQSVLYIKDNKPIFIFCIQNNFSVHIHIPILNRMIIPYDDIPQMNLSLYRRPKPYFTWKSIVITKTVTFKSLWLEYILLCPSLRHSCSVPNHLYIIFGTKMFKTITFDLSGLPVKWFAHQLGQT